MEKLKPSDNIENTSKTGLWGKLRKFLEQFPLYWILPALCMLYNIIATDVAFGYYIGTTQDIVTFYYGIISGWTHPASTYINMFSPSKPYFSLYLSPFFYGIILFSNTLGLSYICGTVL